MPVEAHNSEGFIGVHCGTRTWVLNLKYNKSEVVNAIMDKWEDRIDQKKEHTENRSLIPVNDEDIVAMVMHYLLVQYSLKKGLEFFGTRIKEANKKELKQFHTMDGLIPVLAEELTPE